MTVLELIRSSSIRRIHRASKPPPLRGGRHRRNFSLHRLLKIHLPRHNHSAEPRPLRLSLPDTPERTSQLRDPFSFRQVATGWHLRRSRVDAGFGEQGDVLMFLGRHGAVGVLEADADFGFALVQHVPVVERGHGALRWDDEGLAAWCCLGHEWWDLRLGHSLRDWLDDMVGHLVLECWIVWVRRLGGLECSVVWARGLSGPILWVWYVRYLGAERVQRCCDRFGLEFTRLAVEWAWGAAVHALAGLVQVSVAGDAWWS